MKHPSERRRLGALKGVFHVKHPPQRAALGLFLLLALPLIAACSVSDQPDGWAAPALDPVEENQILLPTGEESVTALQLIGPGAAAPLWTFPNDDDEFPGLDQPIEAVAFYADPLWVDFTGEWLLAEYASGTVYAIQRDGSSARAVFDVEDRIVADLALDPQRPGVVYIATTGYQVHAIQLEQPGEVLWSWDGDSDRQIWGAPALADTPEGRLLIVGGLDGRITALRVEGAEAGDVAWSRQIEAGIASALTLDGQLILFGGFDRIFYALDAASGDTVWSNQGSHWFWSTPVVYDRIVYAVDLRGNVYAWDVGSGAQRWASPYNADDRIRTQPLLVRGEHEEDDSPANDPGVLVIVSREGTVHQLDPASGALLQQFEGLVPDDVLANMILLNGQLFVGNESGELFAVLLDAYAAQRIYPPG